MKLLHKLLPAVTIVSATAMVTPLVSCNQEKPTPEKTEFKTSKGTMSSATEATFELDWENGHSLTFGSNWEFMTKVGTVKSVKATGGDTRPQVVSVTFNKEMTKTDIEDGKLTFTYNDLTNKEENITTTVENICITKYTPPTPPGPTPVTSSWDDLTKEFVPLVESIGPDTKTETEATNDYFEACLNNYAILAEDFTYGMIQSIIEAVTPDSGSIECTVTSILKDGEFYRCSMTYNATITADPGNSNALVTVNISATFKNIAVTLLASDANKARIVPIELKHSDTVEWSGDYLVEGIGPSTPIHLDNTMSDKEIDEKAKTFSEGTTSLSYYYKNITVTKDPE